MRLGLVCAFLALGVLYRVAPSRSVPSAPLDVWPVSLGERTAHRLGVGPGELLDLAVHPTGPWQPARVAEVYRPVRYPTEVGRESLEIRLHLPDLQTLAGRGDEVDSIVVRLRSPDGPALARTGRAAGAGGTTEVVTRLNASPLGFRAYTSAELAARNSSPFEVIARFHRAIGAVTVLASSVFLVTIMTLKGEEMRRQVGVMRLIGVSPRTVVGTVLAIAAGVALLGSLIGIGLGYLLSLGINAYYRSLFGTDLVFSRITPHLLGTSAGVSALLGIAAGAFTAWRVLRQGPLEQLGR
jgi:putative ABC transport system permease protein